LELERLSVDTFVFMEVQGAEYPIAVSLKDPSRRIVAGDRLGIAFDPARAHLFDAHGDVITAPRRAV
jgi:hypothetical protein